MRCLLGRLYVSTLRLSNLVLVHCAIGSLLSTYYLKYSMWGYEGCIKREEGGVGEVLGLKFESCTCTVVAHKAVLQYIYTSILKRNAGARRMLSTIPGEVTA